MSKKGISPLIATVLIVGLTIAMATAVMFWGRNLVESFQKDSELTAATQLACSQSVGLKVKTLCYDGTNIKISLENTNQQEISGFNLRLRGSNSDQIAHEPPNTILPSLGIKTFSIPHSMEIVGNIRAIDVIPKITFEEQSFFCTEKAISLEGISNCEEPENP